MLCLSEEYTDTLTALDNADITHFGYDDTAVMDIKGIKVGLVGIYELKDHLGREQQLKDNIAKVKASIFKNSFPTLEFAIFSNLVTEN